MYPRGVGEGTGTHLSVFLEVQDGIWEPSIEFKMTLINQADASKSQVSSGQSLRSYCRREPDCCPNAGIC
jgi:hypothetical protein